MLQEHAVVFSYEENEENRGPLACAADLPHDETSLQKYAKDLRFNGRTEKIFSMHAFYHRPRW